jgi:hypothetical protein
MRETRASSGREEWRQRKRGREMTGERRMTRRWGRREQVGRRKGGVEWRVGGTKVEER